jgi:hypothetical protein
MMDLPAINSDRLKTEALCWLRFSKQLDYVCTEGGPWSSDVLGACKSYIVEVEVKVSRADILAEFRNKKNKYAYYDSIQKFTPNYFYFCVPHDLGPEASQLIAEKYPKAGVLVYRYPNLRPGNRLLCVKPGKKLHAEKPSDKFLRSVWRRASSELCGLHVAVDELSAGKIDPIDDIKKNITETIKWATGIEEWESGVPLSE